VGPVAGSWNTPSNWSTGAVPVNGDSASISASDSSTAAWNRQVFYDGFYSPPGLATFTISAQRNNTSGSLNNPTAFYGQTSSRSLVATNMVISASGASSTGAATAWGQVNAGTIAITQDFTMQPNPVLGTASFGSWRVSFGLTGAVNFSVSRDLNIGNTNVEASMAQGNSATVTIGRDLFIKCIPGAKGDAEYASVGTLTIGGTVKLEGSAARFRQLGGSMVAGDVTIDIAGVTTGSRMDVNDAVVFTAASLASVQNYIQHARHGGAWDRPGMTSSAAANDAQHDTTLGLLSGADFIAINGAGATFDNHLVAAGDVLVKYTYYGDTDLNGIVNFDDYARIDGGFNNASSGWVNGDFDLNGVVNFDDYALIDLAFNSQGAPLSVPVPEPSLSILLLLTPVLCRRLPIKS
jgi:hypothetical protein